MNYRNKKKYYRVGGELPAPRLMDKIISYLKVGAGHRYPREFEMKMRKAEELFRAGEIDELQRDEMIRQAGQSVDEYTGSDGRVRGSFIDNPEKREAMDSREIKMNKGGLMEGEEDLLAALNRANKERRDFRKDAKSFPRTAAGFIIEGDDDPNKNIIKDVIQASETTNRVGGVDPQVATLRYVPRTPAMTKTIEDIPQEEPRTIIPPERPTEPPKEIPREVDFNMDTSGLESSAIFDRGIAQSGMRGQGTTGGFKGVRSDITKDGRLMEKGEVTSVDDLPEYIREDPTFKNLLSQANETKYLQDIGRKEGKYSTPGGQAAKDLADIMSGRITLDAYKERQNRASASFGYGGEMKFGVIKKRRGGR